MAKDKRQMQEDDGRTYANMNVEGMPWYRPEKEDQPQSEEKIQLTKSEARWAMWGALKAALLVTGVFAVVFFLFILFCDQIWLR